MLEEDKRILSLRHNLHGLGNDVLSCMCVICNEMTKSCCSDWMLHSLSRSHKQGQRVRMRRVEAEYHQMMYVVDHRHEFLQDEGSSINTLSRVFVEAFLRLAEVKMKKRRRVTLEHNRIRRNSVPKRAVASYRAATKMVLK